MITHTHTHTHTHIKHPIVHVRVWWIMETLNPAPTKVEDEHYLGERDEEKERLLDQVISILREKKREKNNMCQGHSNQYERINLTSLSSCRGSKISLKHHPGIPWL